MNLTTLSAFPLSPETTPAVSSDFDFWFGSWRVQHERLIGADGSDAWEEFEGAALAWPILGGLGNMDEFTAPTWRSGYTAMNLRLFTPATQQWSLYAMDNVSGALESPLVGTFVDGVGTFSGTRTLRGQPVDVRVIWTRFSMHRVSWEQAFSKDGGVSWETNWMMRMERNHRGL